MIKITETPTYKMPGETSLFIEFEYKKEIVDTIKMLPCRQYHKKLNVWEVPVTSLARCIESLINYDEIELHILKDSKEEKLDTKYELMNFKTKPYSYQEQGIQFGLNHNKWLLLDDMGLGKTLQMIYLAQQLKERENINHCLIICGVNTLKYNWKNEILTHSDLSVKIIGEKINKKGKSTIGTIKDRVEDLKKGIEEFFIITNIETLRNDDILKELKKSNFDMIVFDELHQAKSPTSQQGKNLLKLSAKYMIGLTGTLLTNNPLDAYVPLKWIGVENSTYTNFKYYYCNFTGAFNNILLGYKNLNVLKDMIDKNSLRRTKDILDLPPKNIIHEIVEMDNKQSTFYNNIVNGVKDEVDKVELKNATVLSMVTRLRQVTACPSILTTEDIPSVKVERAIDLAKQIINNGDKVVIFSVFKETLNKVYEELKSYNPLLCTGDIKDSVITENINKFQNEENNKVILATTSKMGTGITLTKARYAVFIDTPWTSALCKQCEDRIYRIGSEEPVFIYYLWTKDTIDERVKTIVEDKEAISDFIVDNKITKKSIESLKKYITDL